MSWIGPSHPIRMVVGADDTGVAQAFPNTELTGRDSAHPARRKVLTTFIGAGVHFFRTRFRMHILGAGSHLRLKDNDIALSARFGISCARRCCNRHAGSPLCLFLFTLALGRPGLVTRTTLRELLTLRIRGGPVANPAARTMLWHFVQSRTTSRIERIRRSARRCSSHRYFPLYEVCLERWLRHVHTMHMPHSRKPAYTACARLQ